jgi:hypothetical protein
MLLIFGLVVLSSTLNIHKMGTLLIFGLVVLSSTLNMHKMGNNQKPCKTHVIKIKLLN